MSVKLLTISFLCYSTVKCNSKFALDINENEMKKYILPTLLLNALLTLNGYAQERPVTGPKAKNEKVWETNSQKTVIYTKIKVIPVTGPEAKNKKKVSSNESKQPVITIKKAKIYGPKAKNIRPETRRFYN